MLRRKMQTAGAIVSRRIRDRRSKCIRHRRREKQHLHQEYRRGVHRVREGIRHRRHSSAM